MSLSESHRVLKANSLRGLGSKVVFNYEDLKQRCDSYVERVREQTQQMIDVAQAEVEGIRGTAYEESRSRGRQEGLRDARSEIEKHAQKLADHLTSEKLKTTLPALQVMSEMLAQQRDRWLSDWEATAIRISAAIAGKILHTELKHKPETAERILREVLELVTGTQRLSLKMNPEDLALLGDQAQEVVQAIASCGEAKLIPDDSISRGGCVIETQHGVVDARLETQLERIASELISQH